MTNFKWITLVFLPLFAVNVSADQNERFENYEFFEKYESVMSHTGLERSELRAYIVCAQRFKDDFERINCAHDAHLNHYGASYEIKGVDRKVVGRLDKIGEIRISDLKDAMIMRCLDGKSTSSSSIVELSDEQADCFLDAVACKASNVSVAKSGELTAISTSVLRKRFPYNYKSKILPRGRDSKFVRKCYRDLYVLVSAKIEDSSPLGQRINKERAKETITDVLRALQTEFPDAGDKVQSVSSGVSQ